MLPGLCAPSGFMATGADPFWSSTSAENNGIATTLAINKPTGAVSSDLLISFVMAASGVTWTGASGWTEGVDQGADPSLRNAYLVAGGSEPSSYTFTGSGAGGKMGIILCYRGVSWDAVGASVSTLTGDGSLVISGVTSTAGAGGGVLLAAVASGDTVGATHSVPSGMRLLTSYRETATNRLLSIFTQNISSGATGTRTCTIGGGTVTDNAGVLVALK